jgi:hypothetical protein
MFVLLVAVSVNVSEPVEHIHSAKAPIENEDVRDKTVLGHPPSMHPKYECENCLDLNQEKTLEMLARDGLTLELGATEQFYVTENPSTGYRWLVDQKNIDTSVIKLEEKFTQQSMKPRV